jgi:Ca2+-binding RTX toxin-like protein
MAKTINLTDKNDNKTGTDVDEYIYGKGGNDTINGAGGNDKLDAVVQAMTS